MNRERKTCQLWHYIRLILPQVNLDVFPACVEILELQSIRNCTNSRGFKIQCHSLYLKKVLTIVETFLLKHFGHLCSRHSNTTIMFNILSPF